MNKISFNIIFVLSLLMTFNKVFSQVSIINASTNNYNITPAGLLEVNVMNFQNDMQVVLEGKILTSQNEPILDVVSAPFMLKKGMNVTSQLSLHIVSAVYSSSEQSNYIKTSHTLPSGKYHYCAIIKSVPNDIVTDEYCQDIESEVSSFLFLVSPPDKDEIETKYPVLIWTHSEPFSLNNQSDYYRIIVTNLNPDQSPEAAVNVNVPIYMKNYLTSHSVLYPIDAKELELGKKYAWQVQKLYNGAIVNKTEAWEFRLKAPESVKENKYALVKKTLDATFYVAEGNKIFFRFDEGYGSNLLNYKIINEKQEVVTASKKSKGVNIESVKTGYNQFCINLNSYKIGKGIYILEVVNEKNETFKLKFTAE